MEMKNQEVNERIRSALKNTKELIIGDRSYLESQLLQRIEGPTNAGSSYENMTPAELLEKLYNADWEQVEVEGVMQGCTAFKTDLPGLNGILDFDKLPEDAELYAIDPKGTGKIGIGAANVEKTPEEDTYLIVGEEDGKEVVYTFHPGKPIAPSMVDSKDYPHGTKISLEEAKIPSFQQKGWQNYEQDHHHQQTVRQRRKRAWQASCRGAGLRIL